MSSSRRDRLFVYGTLRKGVGHPMSQVLSRYSSYLSNATIRGELYDLGRYPGMALPQDCRTLVVGEVYELNPDTLTEAWRELDAYEGCGPTNPRPHEYERRLIRVTLADGTETDAWVYVLRVVPPEAVRIPTGDYVAWRTCANLKGIQHR